MKRFTLKSAAAACLLLLSQNLLASTAFTNAYAHAEVSESGQGEIYLTSDDPAPVKESERGEMTETQFTTGTDGDQQWTDADGVDHKLTIYWGTVFVAPADGYRCLGLVKELYDNVDEYTDEDFLRGMASDESGDDKKAQLIKWNDDDNHIIEALCNPDKGVKVNMNFNGELTELTNSSQFSDGAKPAAELARDAAREKGFDDEPNTTFYALMAPVGTDGIEHVKVTPVTLKGQTFDMAGRRVNAAQKGIVIINGKKTVRK